ncbi:MAG: oligosaccharide flippase family protein, partial [Planctomycetota bacterium]
MPRPPTRETAAAPAPAALASGALDSAKRGLLAKVMTVASGHVLGYGLAWAAAPLLTRLYPPESFGYFAIFVICLSSLGTIATLRFDQALPLVRQGRQAVVMIGFGLAAAIGCGLIAWATMPVVALLASGAGAPAPPEGFGVLMAVGCVLLSLYCLLGGWLVRAQDYAGLSRMRIAYAVGSLASQVLLPICLGSVAMGLGCGQVVGYGAGVLAALAMARRDWPATPGRLGRRVRVLLRRHRQYPVYATQSAFVSNLTVYSPAILLAWLYGPIAAGHYALAMRLLVTPMSMLSHAFSRVVYGEAVREGGSPAAVERLFWKTLRHEAMIAGPPLLIAAPVSLYAFGDVFGADWVDAGAYFAILSPMLLLYVGSYSVAPVLDVLHPPRSRS